MTKPSRHKGSKSKLVLAIGFLPIGLVAIALVWLGVGAQWDEGCATRLYTSPAEPSPTLASFCLLVSLGMAAAKPLSGSIKPQLTTIETRTLAGFLATLVLVLLAGAYAYLAHRDAEESAKWVAHTQEVRDHLARLRVSISEAESHQRNYLLTGNRAYVEEYQKNARDATHQAMALEMHITDNLEQLEDLKRLQVVIAERAESLESGLITFESSGIVAAQERIARGRGLGLMQEIRDLIQKMDSAEEQLLADRQKIANVGKGKTVRAVTLALGLALIGFALLFRGIRSEMKSRLAAEESLQTSQHRLQLALEASAIGDWELDVATQRVRHSKRYNEIFGYAQPTFEWSYSKFLEHVHEDDRNRVDQIFQESMAVGRDWFFECRILRADEKEGWIWSRGNIFKDSSDQPIFLLGMVGDITERKLAEEALRQSEENLAVTLHSIGDALLVTDAQRRITRMNSVAEKLTGWTIQEALGRSVEEVFQIISETTRQPSNIPVQDVLASGDIRGLANHTLLVSRDGTEYPIADSAAPIRDRDGTIIGVVLVFRDVTEEKKAEKVIRDSEAMTRTVLNSLMANIVVIDAQGTIIAINDGWEKFACKNSDSDLPEVGVGANYLEVCERATTTSDQEAQEILEGIRSVLEHRRPTFRHTYACHSPTEKHWFTLQVSPLSREEGGAVIAHSDATERKLAEQVLSDFKAALDEHSLVTIADAHGKILYVNDKFCAISKYPREELIGKDHRIMNAGYHTRDFFKEMWDTITSGRVWHGEIKNRTKLGSTYWVDTTIVPFLGDNGKPAQYIAIRGDLTQRKQAEEALRRANAELDGASRHKDEFLTNMSHELRTPLNAILGLSEALLEQSTTLTPRQTKSITTIMTSGQHLLALINDILDLSKIEAGKLTLHPETLNVEDLCQSCLAFIRTQAMKKQIRIEHQCDPQLPEVVADPKRIKQILVNLLTNAVKFTPDNGQIGLIVHIPKGEETVCFTVWDTGIGIAEADATKLFRAFTQIDSGLNRAQEGTGLGLALVSKLVELHGGSVALESDTGVGSRFTVTLPISTVSPLTAEEVLEIGSDTGATSPRLFHRALIIEDDPTAAEVLVGYLVYLGITSVLHADGEGAVEAARREQPDVILLDIQLPGESGWIVLTKLKENPKTKDIPVVVTSVLDEPQRSRKLGAAAHFTKPLTRSQLAGFFRNPDGWKTGRGRTSTGDWRQASSPKGPCILLAEDNEANIETIGGYLEDKGFDMHYAKNGLMAIKFAQELRPKLILMDIQMPIMDGLSAIKRIREDAALKGIPIFALTALAMRGDRQRCLAAGANDYLSKPVSLKELAERIRKELHMPDPS